MNEKDSLVNEAATYDDLTKLTKEVRSLLDGRVSPGAGVVLAFAAQEDGSNIIATYTGKADNISSMCMLNDEYRTDVAVELHNVAVELHNVWKTLQLESEPPVILLSDMWGFFTRNDYLSTKNLKAIRRAEASGFEVKLSPVLLWRGREGKKVLEVRIPAYGVRQALELVFLIHVWNFLYDLGLPGVLGSCPIRTHDSNRPAITGLAQGNTTVVSNDMRTAGALYSEIVHLLRANDVRTSDWRINQELGLKPWEG